MNLHQFALGCSNLHTLELECTGFISLCMKIIALTLSAINVYESALICAPIIDCLTGYMKFRIKFFSIMHKMHWAWN